MSSTPEKDHENEHEETGRVVGFGAGALTGAQLGTVLIPIPFVGTFTGAVIGATLGSKVGRQLGPAILDTIDGALNAFSGEASAQPEDAAPATSSGDADVLNQLERLAKLRSQGMLSEEEFAAAKAKLLRR